LRKEVGIALAETAFTAVLWGTSFPVVSVGIKGGLDPRTFVFLRFAIAAPLMLFVAIALGKGVKGLLKSRAVWIVGLLNAAGFLCQFVGQQYTDASVAALLVNLSVVLAAVGAALFLEERFGGLKVAGVVLAVLGTVLITTNGDISVVTRSQALGDGLYLIAAFSWAGYIVYAKKKTDEDRWDPIAVAACIVTVTAVASLPAALTAGFGGVISTGSLGAIAYTAVFNTVIPFVLYQAGLRYLTAGTSAVVLMLEIVVAVLISVAFLGETLTILAWVGAVALLGSILLVSGLEIGGKSLSVSPVDAGPMKDA
jgi:drug/metabolite transporter (DMT)-like permease